MASDTQTDHVSLRVIALAHATNQNEDILLVVGLDTTIAQLKEHLQQKMNQHPLPDTQRLIYQGRPLTEGNATLRQILRRESISTNSPLAHVLHLVIRDDQQPGALHTNRPQPIRTQPPLTNNPPHPPQGPSPVPSAFGLPPQAFPQGHPAQAILQNALQQHMAIHNQHRNLQFPNPQPAMFPIPGVNLPQFPRTQEGLAQSNQTSSEQDNVPLNNSDAQVTPNAPEHNLSGSTAPLNVFRNSMTMRVHETIGPNGERVRRVVQSGPMLPGHTNPVERSASAPGAAPRTATPNPPTRPGEIPAPFPPPFQPFPYLQASQASSLLPPFRPPQLPLGSTTFGIPQQSRQSMVYLVSSPAGPEALLFSPNHGYYSSHHSNSATQVVNQAQQQTGDNQNQTRQQTPIQPIQPTAGPIQTEDQSQVALRPPVPAQAQVQAPAQAQQGRREGEDLVALVLQRGWLFLRLYMFIFVLSEPGTWRRYILLTIASLVCLLPRNNPFTDMFQAARRHFDNLIGPPQVPDRTPRPQNDDRQATGNDTNDNAAANNTGNATSSRQRNVADNQMPTPEEHARRLLREHEERNPHIIRDTLHRIEQAVALFLASLIPGVGERHVRAREEARRIVQEEERRRRQEEEEARSPIDDSSSKSDTLVPSSESARVTDENSAGASTSIDTGSSGNTSTSASEEGLRMRASDTNVSATVN